VRLGADQHDPIASALAASLRARSPASEAPTMTIVRVATARHATAVVK
jgi:hypothetical protein